jgi:hypothetical protein
MAQVLGMFTTVGMGFSKPANQQIAACFVRCDIKNYPSPWAWLAAYRKSIMDQSVEQEKPARRTDYRRHYSGKQAPRMGRASKLKSAAPLD